MPSSITLTVSHLPTSTSFFLSALQPLDYAYRGRTGQTIGFGSAIDKGVPTDFWITQELPGIPAGAAHVAFSASSRAAVQDFFVAALKAGGKIHGEPCVRDASGYYSGAVIDFDGNSIEAVYRPSFSDDKENEAKSVVSRRSSVRAPSMVARSSVSRASSTRSAAPSQPQVPSGDAFNNLFAEARNAAGVARNLVDQVRQHNAPLLQNTGNATSGAVVGTLLGVAAGAALHFVFSNNDNNHPSEAAKSTTDPPPRSEHSNRSQSRQPRAIEAPPSSYHPRMITMHDNDSSASSAYASTIRPRRSRSVASSRRTSTRMLETAPPSSYKAPSALTTTSSRHDDRPSRSRTSSSSHTRTKSRSQSTGSNARTLIRVTETVTSAARYPLPESTVSKATSKRSSRAASPSRYPLPESTISKATSKRSSRAPSPSRYPLPASRVSSARTAFRGEAADYPLPPSRASTWAGSTTSKRESRSGRSHTTSDSKSVISKTQDLRKLDVPRGELTPDDSVSQISVARSERSRRSRR